MKARQRNTNGKDSRGRCELDLAVLANRMLNACFCLLAAAIVCFVLGHSGWGFALLAVIGIVLVLVVAGGFLFSLVWAKMLKDIPHR